MRVEEGLHDAALVVSHLKRRRFFEKNVMFSHSDVGDVALVVSRFLQVDLCDGERIKVYCDKDFISKVKLKLFADGWPMFWTMGGSSRQQFMGGGCRDRTGRRD